MTLLIVNDVAIEASAMASEIPWEKYGITEVFTAFSASEGRSVIQRYTVDILLCDIEMPDENGLSLIRWIKEQAYPVECILLTCHADFEYAREGLSLGCQDYITLPAKYETIAESVRKVVLRHRKRAEDERLQKIGERWLASQEETAGSGREEDSRQSPREVADKCVQYILANLHDCDLSVTQIASTVFLNPIYLNRIFKKEKGISISQWIIKERMGLSSALLLSTNLPAAEIAFRAGYQNYPYFSTVFKKYFGVTPSQYVKDHNAIL